MVDATSTGTTITAYQYSYDNVGNKLGRINADEELTVWTYDAINQLKTETLAPDMSWNTFSVNDWNNFTADDWNNFEASNSSGETTTFTYDPVGNRTLKETETEVTTSTYDVANQHLTSEDSTGVTTFTYDQNGNQTSLETPAGDITTNTWTYENQLRSVENPANELTTYTYTPVNRSSDEYQVQKETETETTKTLWDNNNILQEYDTTTEAQYNYAPQTYGDLISQHRDTESSYYHYDGNYSTSALTDSTQSETDTYNYTAWGEATSNSGTTENPFTWKGEVGYVFDEATGLFTLRRRQYNSDSGRFISEDPIGLNSGDTNFYMYAGNDPVSAIDPSGFAKAICHYKLWTQANRYWVNRTKKIECNQLDVVKCCENALAPSNAWATRKLIKAEWDGEPYASPSTLPTTPPNGNACLIVIDGTDSRDFAETNPRTVFNDCRLPKNRKSYFHGPDFTMTGADADEILKNAYNDVCSKTCSGTCDYFIFVGWSRGASIIMELTNRLHKNACKCVNLSPSSPNGMSLNFTKTPVIKYVGLFDPVQMIAFGNWSWSSPISPYVTNSRIAYAGNRSMYGNESFGGFPWFYPDDFELTPDHAARCFPGIHGDIAGGKYDKDDEDRASQKLALEYIWEGVKAYGGCP